MVAQKVKWIDENTAVSNDGSILVIDDEGSIRHYPGKGWIKPREKYAGKFLDKNPFWHYRLRDAEQSRRIINLMFK